MVSSKAAGNLPANGIGFAKGVISSERYRPNFLSLQEIFLGLKKPAEMLTSAAGSL